MMKQRGGMAYATELLPLSLCDYPKEPATVVFFSGCNYDCGYCQNWHLKKQLPEHSVELEKIKAKIRNNNLVNACKVTGGEPLLQLGSLLELAKFSKSLGLKFGIDTNGSFPESLKALLPMLDLISVDIKTKMQNSEYRAIVGKDHPAVSKVKETLKMSFSSSAFVDVRMVVIPGKNDSLETVRSINKDLIRLGYGEKAREGEASFTLVEFVPENAHQKGYRLLKNPSVDRLRTMAKVCEIKNVMITHRGLGFYVMV